jgi:DNA-binding protein YbaB
VSEYHDHLDAEIERADRKIKETGRRVSAHLHNDPVTGRASAPNGSITVTVRPGGHLEEIEIEHSALLMHPDKLAEELVKLAQQATRKANARMHQSIRSIVSRDVANSLTKLGMAPAVQSNEEIDWADVIRRTR